MKKQDWGGRNEGTPFTSEFHFYGSNVTWICPPKSLFGGGASITHTKRISVWSACATFKFREQSDKISTTSLFFIGPTVMVSSHLVGQHQACQGWIWIVAVHSVQGYLILATWECLASYLECWTSLSAEEEKKAIVLVRSPATRCRPVRGGPRLSPKVQLTRHPHEDKRRWKSMYWF